MMSRWVGHVALNKSQRDVVRKRKEKTRKNYMQIEDTKMKRKEIGLVVVV
jgi:hypothetical protein